VIKGSYQGRVFGTRRVLTHPAGPL